jgi:uncharacterized protein YjbJ (UPF0337 family)
MGETKGSARRIVGWATGDRKVEAEGKVEQEAGEKPDDEDIVEDVKEDVKREHGDFGRAGERLETTDQ